MGHQRITRRHRQAIIIGAAGIPYGLVCFAFGRTSGCVAGWSMDGFAAAVYPWILFYPWSLGAAVIAIAAGIVLTVLQARMHTGSIATTDHAPNPPDRRRDGRIDACIALHIRVAPAQYPAAGAALLNASTGGLALTWQGPSLPTNSRVELSIDGYSAVHAVVMAHDGSLLRLRFADASSRGERAWLRSACLSSSAEP